MNNGSVRLDLSVITRTTLPLPCTMLCFLYLSPPSHRFAVFLILSMSKLFLGNGNGNKASGSQSSLT